MIGTTDMRKQASHVATIPCPITNEKAYRSLTINTLQ